MAMRSVWRDQRGFSLAELLVVTAVLGLVMAAVIAIQQKGQQAYIYGSTRVEAQQNARVALDRITRELRSAQQINLLPSNTDLTFTVCSPDIMASCSPVSVQYQLSGTNLNRISGGSTETLIGGVRAGGLSMTYCKTWVINSCTTTTTNASEVRVILVRLTAWTEDAASSNSMGDRRMTVESAIRLRNVNSSF